MADEPAFSAATFLGKAQDDLRTAEILLREPLSPRWPIGFHLQQAAEKAFKALIAAGGIEPPRTHSLRLLAESVAPAHPRVAAFLGRVAPLQAFAVQQRYARSRPARKQCWTWKRCALWSPRRATASPARPEDTAQTLRKLACSRRTPRV